MKIEIAGPGYLGRSSNVNASRCVNFYPEINSQDSKSNTALIGTPGTLLFVDTYTSVIRGMHFFNELIYFIAGNKLFSVNNAGFVATVIDAGTGLQVTLSTSTGQVSMANNGMYSIGGAVANQLIIADGQNIYVLNVSTFVLTSFAYPANTVCFIGGYFVIDIAGAQWRVSNLYDGTVWNALDISTADSSPDNLMTVINNHNELWLIGEYTTEIWYQSGSGNPPFSRQGGGVLDYGTVAPYSVAKGSNTLFWLFTQRNGDVGTTFGIGMINGYSMEPISTQSINYQISKYAVVTDAFAYCYTDRGHEFYVITFPTANATWVYDITTRIWHERSLYTTGPYIIGRHISNCYVYAWGKHFVGDFQSSKILEMSENFYTDNGLQISSLRTFSPLDDKISANRFFINEFQLEMETGTGNTATFDAVSIPELNLAVGADPSIMTFDGTYIWVINSSAKTVSKIDRNTNSVIATIILPTTNSLAGIVSGEGYIWVSTSLGSNNIFKIDADTNAIISNFSVTLGPREGMVYADGFVWMAGYTNGFVYKVDPSTDAITNIVLLGDFLLGCDYNGGELWITQSAGNVKRINATTGVTVATIAVGVSPVGIKYFAGFVWVANFGASTVSKINPATNTVVATITVGLNPRELEFDGTDIWISNYGAGTLVRINPVTNAIISTLDLSATLAGIAYDPINKNLWVSKYSSDEVCKVKVWEYTDSADPKALLSWSNDGGHNWSNDHHAHIGKQGEYLARVIWNRLGCSRNRIFRIAISSPVKKILIGACVKGEGGTT